MGSPGSLLASEQGHMIVSPAVGQKWREKELLKQCLKKTWRHTQKIQCCFSSRAPRMRLEGVDEGGTSIGFLVHLQVGRGFGSWA